MLKLILVIAVMGVIFCFIMAVLSSKEPAKKKKEAKKENGKKIILSRKEALSKVTETKDRAEAYFFGFCIASFMTILVMGILFGRIDTRLGIIVGLVLLVVLAVLILSGIEKIPSNQQGVKVFLGLARKSIESGPRIKIPGFEIIQRVPRMIFRIEKVMANVMTQNGEVSIEMSLYVSFGRTEDNLLQIVHYLPPNILTAFSRLSEIEEGNKSEDNRNKEATIIEEIRKALGFFLDPVVESVTRNQAAKLKWQDINEEKQNFAETVYEQLVHEPVVDLSGISENIDINIKDLNPNQIIKDSVNKAEASSHEILTAKRKEEAQGERLRQEQLQIEEFVKTIKRINPEITAGEIIRIFFTNKFMEEKISPDSKFNFISSDLTNLVDSILKKI